MEFDTLFMTFAATTATLNIILMLGFWWQTLFDNYKKVASSKIEEIYPIFPD